MDTETKRGLLIDTDAATKIYLMQQKLDFLMDIEDTTSLFINVPHGSKKTAEEMLAEVRKHVAEFKNKFSYEEPQLPRKGATGDQ
jgi:hypothetical protein